MLIHKMAKCSKGVTSERIFSNKKARPDQLLDFHTFGSPACVLGPKLQQGKILKWQ
jgi:hypothetical protein